MLNGFAMFRLINDRIEKGGVHKWSGSGRAKVMQSRSHAEPAPENNSLEQGQGAESEEN